MVKIEYRKAVRLGIHVNQRHQQQHRADKGIEEELEGCVYPVDPTSYADNEEHRDQHGFKEDVKQYRVERGKGADHQTFHDQKCRKVL